MLTIEKLKEYGADTDEGLKRCMGNEALYLRLAAMADQQPEFQELESLIKDNDLKSAFHAAHSLKGVFGNLAITPLYDRLCEITELLRSETPADYESLVIDIMKFKDKYSSICQ
ncbi:Hpt domain-containing protein [Lachnospiraceae bacterium JC7]|nr:Hpt domain-containing protein [Lachnospiraceae bacterium JC7]